jgi:hypothetical protein
MILLSDHYCDRCHHHYTRFIATVVLYEYFGMLHRSKIRARRNKIDEPSEAITEVKRNPLEETSKWPDLSFHYVASIEPQF